MTKERGILYGSKLGQVKEVDVEDDGRSKHDFFFPLMSGSSCQASPENKASH